MERAPLRRPMMFSRLARAASRSGAALASPVKRSREATHWPLPDRRSGPVQSSTAAARARRRRSAPAGSCPWGAAWSGAKPCARPSARAWPATDSRPSAQSSSSDSVRSASSPSSCSVFQGVPSPASSEAGHWEWPSADPQRAGVPADAPVQRQRLGRAAFGRQHDVHAAGRGPQPPLQARGQGGRVAAAGAAGQHHPRRAVPDRAAGVLQQHLALGGAGHARGQPLRGREQHQRAREAEQHAAGSPAPRRCGRGGQSVARHPCPPSLSGGAGSAPGCRPSPRRQRGSGAPRWERPGR